MFSKIQTLNHETFPSFISSIDCFTKNEGIVGHATMKGTSAPLLDYTAPQVVICVVTLKNGTTFTGTSTCAANAGFNFEVGSEKAKLKALNKAKTYITKQLEKCA